jgi:hypothetical protein
MTVETFTIPPTADTVEQAEFVADAVIRAHVAMYGPRDLRKRVKIEHQHDCSALYTLSDPAPEDLGGLIDQLQRIRSTLQKVKVGERADIKPPDLDLYDRAQLAHVIDLRVAELAALMRKGRGPSESVWREAAVLAVEHLRIRGWQIGRNERRNSEKEDTACDLVAKVMRRYRRRPQSYNGIRDAYYTATQQAPWYWPAEHK